MQNPETSEIEILSLEELDQTQKASLFEYTSVSLETEDLFDLMANTKKKGFVESVRNGNYANLSEEKKVIFKKILAKCGLFGELKNIFEGNPEFRSGLHEEDLEIEKLNQKINAQLKKEWQESKKKLANKQEETGLGREFFLEHDLGRKAKVEKIHTGLKIQLQSRKEVEEVFKDEEFDIDGAAILKAAEKTGLPTGLRNLLVLIILTTLSSGFFGATPLANADIQRTTALEPISISSLLDQIETERSLTEVLGERLSAYSAGQIGRPYETSLTGVDGVSRWAGSGWEVRNNLTGKAETTDRRPLVCTDLVIEALEANGVSIPTNFNRRLVSELEKYFLSNPESFESQSVDQNFHHGSPFEWQGPRCQIGDIITVRKKSGGWHVGLVAAIDESGAPTEMTHSSGAEGVTQTPFGSGDFLGVDANGNRRFSSFFTFDEEYEIRSVFRPKDETALTALEEEEPEEINSSSAPEETPERQTVAWNERIIPTFDDSIYGVSGIISDLESSGVRNYRFFLEAGTAFRQSALSEIGVPLRSDGTTNLAALRDGVEPGMWLRDFVDQNRGELSSKEFLREQIRSEALTEGRRIREFFQENYPQNWLEKIGETIFYHASILHPRSSSRFHIQNWSPEQIEGDIHFFEEFVVAWLDLPEGSYQTSRIRLPGGGGMFRNNPNHGKILAVAESLGASLELWDVDSEDWRNSNLPNLASISRSAFTTDLDDDGETVLLFHTQTFRNNGVERLVSSLSSAQQFIATREAHRRNLETRQLHSRAAQQTLRNQRNNPRTRS